MARCLCETRKSVFLSTTTGSWLLATSLALYNELLLLLFDDISMVPEGMRQLPPCIREMKIR